MQSRITWYTSRGHHLNRLDPRWSRHPVLIVLAVELLVVPRHLRYEKEAFRMLCEGYNKTSATEAIFREFQRGRKAFQQRETYEEEFQAPFRWHRGVQSATTRPHVWKCQQLIETHRNFLPSIVSASPTLGR